MIMGTTERILGMLQEHKNASDVRFDRLEEKVDSLLQFKWKVLGISSCVAFITAILIELVRK